MARSGLAAALPPLSARPMFGPNRALGQDGPPLNIYSTAVLLGTHLLGGVGRAGSSPPRPRHGIRCGSPGAALGGLACEAHLSGYAGARRPVCGLPYRSRPGLRDRCLCPLHHWLVDEQDGLCELCPRCSRTVPARTAACPSLRLGASFRQGVSIRPYSMHRTPGRSQHRTFVGSIGDSYDNALAETINGLYKAKAFIELDRGAPSRPSSSRR